MTLEAPYGNRKTGEQRLTKGCRRVLAALEQMDNLTSAQDIHGMLRQSAPEAPGLTTVYRSLDSLVALGLVQSVDIGDGEKRYELVVPGDNNIRKRGGEPWTPSAAWPSTWPSPS